VFDTDDMLEFVQAGGVGSSDVFATMIDLCNKELSKLFLGQTMTTEDGSSRAQAEVHQTTRNILMDMYYRFVTDTVNMQLLPLMARHGMIPEGLRFDFQWTEKDLTQEQKINAVVKLAPYFDFDTEYIKEFIGLEVLPRRIPVPGSPVNRLDKYYGSKKS
jgi:phage gp29-like protein